MDVLPGRYTQLWFNATTPGRYQILCAEYCGAGHSIMRGEVIELKPQDYEDWLAPPPRRPVAPRERPDRAAGRPAHPLRVRAAARQPDRPGPPHRRRAGLRQVPLHRRDPAHRADLAGPVPPPREAHRWDVGGGR